MVKFCPVTFRNINENVSRLNAFFTLLFVIGFLITGSFWFLIVLSLDFILRLSMEGKINPIIRMNIYLLDLIKIPKVMINAGPKVFAAQIGLFLSIIGLLLFIIDFSDASLAVLAVLGFFSFLEFAFGLCVACKIYPYALYLNDLRIFK